MDTERNYLQEARAIVNGSRGKGASALLPEVAHLKALEEAHQSEIILIAHEFTELAKRILRRN